MPRHVPVSIALLSQSVGRDERVRSATWTYARAGGASRPPLRGGHIRGVVRDEHGSAVGGVSIVALGTTLASAQSDSTGRFTLALPPGEYVLRADARRLRLDVSRAGARADRASSSSATSRSCARA